MAEGTRRMRRFRWLVIAGVVGAGVWAARSRQRSSGLLLEQWPAPDPTAPAGGAATRQPLTAVPDLEPTPPSPTPPSPTPPAAGPSEANGAPPASMPTGSVERGAGPGSGEVAAGAAAPVGTDPDLAPAVEIAAEPAPTAPVSGPSEDGTPSAAPTAPDPVAPEPGDVLPSNVSGEALFAPATPAAGMPATTARPSPRPRSAEPLRDYGPGSAEPQPDGSAPGPEYTIKGEAGSMLFHRPDSPHYSRTTAEVWFRTATDARAAGFVEWVPTAHGGS